MDYVYPDKPKIEITAIPAPWVCPRCNKVNAPWVDQCSCPATKYKPPNPFIWPTDPRIVPSPWPSKTDDPMPGPIMTGDPLPDQEPYTGDNTASNPCDCSASVSSPKIDYVFEVDWNGLFGPHASIDDLLNNL